MTPLAPLLSNLPPAKGSAAAPTGQDPASRPAPRHVLWPSVLSLLCLAGFIALQKLDASGPAILLQACLFLGWLVAQVLVLLAARTPFGIGLAVANLLFLWYDAYLINWPMFYATCAGLWAAASGS